MIFAIYNFCCFEEVMENIIKLYYCNNIKKDSNNSYFPFEKIEYSYY